MRTLAANIQVLFFLYIYQNRKSLDKEFDYNLEISKALFKNATVGILAINNSGSIIMANDYLLKQFEYIDLNELIGQKVEILIPKNLRERHEKHRWDYDQHPQNRPMGIGMDLMGLRKNGTQFPVEISLGHYTIGNERFALAFINDITQRKEIEHRIISLNAELEQKVEKRTQQLSETVQKLEQQIKETEAARAEVTRAHVFEKAILNYAGAIIIATDEKGTIQLFNPVAERMLGYKAEDVIGKHRFELFHDWQETLDRTQEFSAELGVKIKPGFETYVIKSRLNLENEHEWIFVRKDGSKFTVLLTKTSLRNADGKIIGFLGIAHDISHIKKAEEDLQKALEKEKELGELKSRFVSMASHEFRTPLSTILSSAYLLSKYTTTEDQTKRARHIDRIVSSVTMLTDTLNDFLSVGKIEEGKVQVKWKDFDIKENISSTIKEMNGISKKGQTISYHHEGGSSVVLDPTLLKHIMMNLLSNAIKFSPEDSTIEVKSAVENNHIALNVKDQGMGISKEDQENLFERFFRGGNAANIQGTGLGLHIVKKYTEMMLGNIQFKSKLNEGTEFLIEFDRINNIENNNE
jgi:PAS domain S-box-containing protein